jgi:GAF domain-containing protein/anti-sigma regulatory factor (Ser/Thr protein kinase)/PAS domain-containing protein
MSSILDRRLRTSPLVRAGIAGVLAPGIATGIALGLDLQTRRGAQVVYVVLVAVAVVAAGLPAGLLAAVCSFVPFVYFFLNGQAAWSITSSGAVSLVVLGVGMGLVAYIVAREERVRARSAGAIEVSEALEHVGLSVWRWDPQRDRLRWSHDVRAMYGLERTQRLDTMAALRSWVHPADRAVLAAALESALAERSSFEVDVRTTLTPQGWRWILLHGTVERTVRGRRVTGLARDVTLRHRSEERERFLAGVTKSLAAASDYEGMLSVLASLAVPDIGDWCSIDVAEEDGSIRNVAIAHGDPAKVETAREFRRRFPVQPGETRGAAAVIKTGEPELLPMITDELLAEVAPGPEAAEHLRRLGLGSAIVAPIKVRGRTLGALTLVVAEPPRRYDESDLAFVREVAQMAALMIDNAQLHRDEQEAREEAEGAARRMERLQALTARLSAAAAPAEVAQLLVDESRDVLGARASWVSVLGERPDELQLLAASGYRDDFVQKYRRIPLASDIAVAQVVREGLPQWLESAEEPARRHPELAEGGAASGGEALAILPLTLGERPFGFLALRFDGPRRFAPDERALIASFVGQCSQSLERAELYEREQQARAEAELHRSELQFLEDVSTTLAATVEVDEALDALLTLTVPRLADAVSFFLLEEGRYLRRAATVHVDPEKTTLMRELRGARIDVETEPDSPLALAVRELVPVAIDRLNEDVLRSLSHDEFQLRTLESLGMRAWHAMPLVVRGQAIGVLTLATVGDRTFSPRDLALAREFAGRAALSLTTAYDFERERQARAAAERASERLGHLHRIASALARAVTTEDVARAVAEQGRAAFGADSAATQLLSEDGAELELAAASGHLDDLLGRYGRLSMDQEVPSTAAVRRAEVLWFESADDLAIRFPDHARVREGLEAVGFVPLIGREKPLGLLTVSFERPRPLTAEDRALIDVVLQQCGQALERAQLYEAEQDARRRAEHAKRRVDQLQTIVEVGLYAQSVDELVGDILMHLREMLNADRAALLLLDDETGILRVRAELGIGEEAKNQVGVPLGGGIDGRIAATGEPRIIDDLSTVDVISPYLRESGGSLVGVPLSASGRILGVLNVSALRLNAFTEDDLELLEVASGRVALAFERMMVYEREHEIAVTLQQSVLPGQLPEIERLDVAVRYLPGRNELEVGGDWYDVIELGQSRVGVVVGDVVGKGVIAAAAMAQLRNALRVYALDGLKPSAVLSRLAELARTVGTPFATVLYMVIDYERGICRYASAGHPPALHRRPGWPAVFLEGGRSTPIGIGLEARARQAAVELNPGDLLLLYTDGLVESRSMTLSEGMDRLCEAVESGGEDLDELLDHVGDELAVDTRQDDVALVALRWLPAPSLSLRLPTDPASLAEMRSEVRTWLAGAGVEDGEAHDILVACSEACANAIVHAGETASADFELIGTRRNGEIAVVVRDAGRWRERDPDRDSGGFGLRLMEALMDDVQIATRDTGTEVRLRRRLASTNGGGTSQQPVER